MADLVWYSLVSAGIAYGKKFISDWSYRAIISFCAVVLVGFGLYFSISGIRYLV